MIEQEILDQLIEEFRTPQSKLNGLSHEEWRPKWWNKRIGNNPELLSKSRISTLSIDEALEVFRQLRTGKVRRKQNEFRLNGTTQISKWQDLTLTCSLCTDFLGMFS